MNEKMVGSEVFETQLDESCLFRLQNKTNSVTFDDKEPMKSKLCVQRSASSAACFAACSALWLLLVRRACCTVLLFCRREIESLEQNPAVLCCKLFTLYFSIAIRPALKPYVLLLFFRLAESLMKTFFSTSLYFDYFLAFPFF